MEKTVNINLSTTLTQLIEAKQAKDNKKFNASQLAKAIDVDRSLIQRILSGGMTNPTLSTIIKIVNFFVEDGFSLRIDDLLGLNNKLVNIDNQEISSEQINTLPLYKMECFSGEPIGEISINIQDSSPCVIAVISSIDVPPIFKAGSIFIIDIMKNPEQGHLIALNIDNEIKIAKLNTLIGEEVLNFIEKKEGSVMRYDEFDKNKVLGVVVRINAKT